MVKKYLKTDEQPRDKYSLLHLTPIFTGLKLFKISSELVKDYKDERDEDAAPATVYQELALLRKMFNIARKTWKWVKYNPVSDVSFSVGDKNQRVRWLTMDEEMVLLSKAANPHWLRTILIFAIQTGMRRGELLRLTWADVDFRRKSVSVKKSKNGEPRVIPMSDVLFKALKSIKVVSLSGAVFPISESTLRDGFVEARTKANITDFRFHDLRHTFASRLVQNGVDIFTVSKLLGHKSIAMTMRYAHLNDGALKRGIVVLDDCYKSTTLEAGAIDK